METVSIKDIAFVLKAAVKAESKVYMNQTLGYYGLCEVAVPWVCSRVKLFFIKVRTTLYTVHSGINIFSL